MTIFKYIIVGFTGVSAGILVAGGLFALLSKVGVITRMIGVSGTRNQTKVYEKVIVLGGLWGNIVSVFFTPVPSGLIFLATSGFMYGVFTGALSIALAECINVFPMLLGKMNLKRGIPIILMAFALGKFLGAYYHLSAR